MIITIDGPAASGKSTVARLLAQKLGLFYLNSGLLFRAVAHVLRIEERHTLAEIACMSKEQIETALERGGLEYEYNRESYARVMYQKRELTELTGPEVAQAASEIATLSSVREILCAWQRVLVAKKKNAIVEGRDSGSVVFPQAEYTFFVTASVAVRSARWQQEQKKKGIVMTIAQATKELKKRDARDKGRSIAPLCRVARSIVIDTSYLTIEGAVQEMLQYIDLIVFS